MVVGIELGKEYAQICVKTAQMKDAESVTKIAGEEHYRIPVMADLSRKSEVQEFFRGLWKLLTCYADGEKAEYVVFCLDENSGQLRDMLLEIVQMYEISPQRVRFIDRKESFCAYVFHQPAELLSHSALLIENCGGEKKTFLLQKRTRTVPTVAQVQEIVEKKPEDVFSEHPVSSVFLVGDDFEEEWMQENLKLLKSGRRVFMGKNLYVKGACYAGIDWKEGQETYLYLGEDKLSCNIAIKAREKDRDEFVTIVEGGRNWYESEASLELLLLEGSELEFALIPINGREKKTVNICLEGLPKRPEKTTRLSLELKLTSVETAKLTVRDLGFGELFPRSDLCYEGELQWEQ